MPVSLPVPLPPPVAGSKRLVGEGAEGEEHAGACASSGSSADEVAGAQVARSAGVGLLSGGAQRTAAVTYAPDSSRPSSVDRAQSGWLA